MTLIEEIDIIQKKFNLREWVLNELKNFESKYGMTTKDFIEKWTINEIPEPEEHDLLQEFLEWEGLSISLQKVESELKEIEKRIKES
ncbi:hypothetical protein LCGC14_2048200 [marine sediment metagenome]|uniref:Uncharacterized protein n=1 Tax=marine sediment metagenome TaxID=412755 RepID=A0A0F9FCB2_9ZZZZ